MTDREILRQADYNDQGLRMDKWLAGNTELSRSRIKALIEKGDVNVNGIPVTDPATKVLHGMRYVIKVPPPAAATPEAQDIPLHIVYEDQHLIVVNKPAGMTVHPAPGAPDQTLVNALLFHAKDSLSGIGGVMRPGIVHRIDKNTSGLLVVAKNDKTHQHLSKQFAKHSVERTYHCFVRGGPNPREGRIESRLARSPNNRKKQAVVRGTWDNMEASETGRHAITNYRFLKGYGQMPKASLGTPQFSKIECKLETGRTHQIRVHMAHQGAPLIGDPLYGKQKAFKTSKSDGEIALQTFLSNFNRQALHAYSIGFIHPDSKEFMAFEAAFPEDLAALSDLLEEL